MTQISMPDESVTTAIPMVWVMMTKYTFRSPQYLREVVDSGMQLLNAVDDLQEATKWADFRHASEVLTRAHAGGLSPSWHLVEVTP